MATGYNLEQHIVSVRLRISGSGEFQSKLLALEGNPEQEMVAVTMQSAPNRPVSLLANIRSMRVQYYGYIENIDEHFYIKNITFFTKPIATGYPQ